MEFNDDDVWNIDEITVRAAFGGATARPLQRIESLPRGACCVLGARCSVLLWSARRALLMPRNGNGQRYRGCGKPEGSRCPRQEKG